MSLTKSNLQCCTILELLAIFKHTAAAYPGTRGEQLNIKAHAALCERIQVKPPVPTPAPSEPSGSSQESSQSALQASGTIKLPTTYWTRRGLELKCMNALSSLHSIDPTKKNLAFLEMVNPYVKPGVAISEDDYEELVLAINEAELLCLDPERDEYKITPLTRTFVRGYIAGKGFKTYVC